MTPVEPEHSTNYNYRGEADVRELVRRYYSDDTTSINPLVHVPPSCRVSQLTNYSVPPAPPVEYRSRRVNYWFLIFVVWLFLALYPYLGLLFDLSTTPIN